MSTVRPVSSRETSGSGTGGIEHPHGDLLPGHDGDALGALRPRTITRAPTTVIYHAPAVSADWAQGIEAFLGPKYPPSRDIGELELYPRLVLCKAAGCQSSLSWLCAGGHGPTRNHFPSLQKSSSASIH